mmetsp:Transcript_5240/g.3006  ORF Transcript_5240/g.3006 Transcript_5240/m.3006 type:complete len:109 (-) Transcript_5240:15-341(-)
MNFIETKVDTNSDEYKKNYEAMETLVEDFNEELKKARDSRSRKSLERVKESGKLFAREKLELLLDRNTPFLEIAPLAAKGMYDGKIHKAGIIAGIGVVKGREVLISRF